MSSLPVALRVKRRRGCPVVPAEILLETNARPQDVLAASLQQTLAVSGGQQGAPAVAEGPARKRCRFVLLPDPPKAAAASVAAAEEAQEQLGLADGPVLELWHTSGLSASATAGGAGAAAAGQPPTAGHVDVYAAMLQDFLHEHPQAAAQDTTQQRTYQRPSRRVQHSSSSSSSARDPISAPAASQAPHDQQQALPAYMTKGMLKLYGLWPGLQSQQQPQDGSAGAARGTPRQDSLGDSMEAQFTYDVYVAAAADGSSAGDAAAAGSSHAEPAAGRRGGSEAAALDLPVIQVWDDELWQLQQDWSLAQDGSAEPADSEDSNAEDYYANDYPDEDVCQDDSSSLQDDLLDSEEGGAAAGARRGRPAAGGIGFYQPAGGSGGGRGMAARLGGVQEEESGAGDGGGGYASSASYDAEEYVSSGEEGGGEHDKEGAGPAWLRKHCVAYGAEEGGQAWRSVLAQQFAP